MKLGAEHLLERLPVLGEFLDPLVQLVERHLVLEERPAELGLVVNVRDLGQLLRDCGGHVSDKRPLSCVYFFRGDETRMERDKGMGK